MSLIAAPNSFLSKEELVDIGFSSFGEDVQISRFCRIYGAAEMCIGDRVRIDDFAILTGRITIGSHVHIAAYTSLHGRYGIELSDFVNLSSRVSIYSVSDDFSGETLTSPLVPNEFRKVDGAPVRLGRHVIIGSGTVILPGTEAGDGVAIGALSLAKGNLQEWSVYHGVPAKRRGDRSRSLQVLEARYLEDIGFISN
jgi:acetyltransferase-like isoleucine patch superfamily enzyme